jgi:hypothetical protein
VTRKLSVTVRFRAASSAISDGISSTRITPNWFNMSNTSVSSTLEAQMRLDINKVIRRLSITCIDKEFSFFGLKWDFHWMYAVTFEIERCSVGVERDECVYADFSERVFVHGD